MFQPTFAKPLISTFRLVISNISLYKAALLCLQPPLVLQRQQHKQEGKKKKSTSLPFESESRWDTETALLEVWFSFSAPDPRCVMKATSFLCKIISIQANNLLGSNEDYIDGEFLHFPSFHHPTPVVSGLLSTHIYHSFLLSSVPLRL